jgi:hypothetical protein
VLWKARLDCEAAAQAAPKKERGELMVEFDNMKLTLSDYEQPLLEMGNSL